MVWSVTAQNTCEDLKFSCRTAGGGFKNNTENGKLCVAAWRLTNMALLFNRCEKVNPTNYGSINVILIEGKILG